MVHVACYPQKSVGLPSWLGWVALLCLHFILYNVWRMDIWEYCTSAEPPWDIWIQFLVFCLLSSKVVDVRFETLCWLTCFLRWPSRKCRPIWPGSRPLSVLRELSRIDCTHHPLLTDLLTHTSLLLTPSHSEWLILTLTELTVAEWAIPAMCMTALKVCFCHLSQCEHACKASVLYYVLYTSLQIKHLCWLVQMLLKAEKHRLQSLKQVSLFLATLNFEHTYLPTFALT